MFNRPGMGMLGGLAAGFLGAGLLGMMFGGGLFGGLGGLASMFGLLLQVGLIALVVMLALRWWRSRNAPSYASGPANFDAGQPQQAQQPQQPRRAASAVSVEWAQRLLPHPSPASADQDHAGRLRRLRASARRRPDRMVE